MVYWEPSQNAQASKKTRQVVKSNTIWLNYFSFFPTTQNQRIKYWFNLIQVAIGSNLMPAVSIIQYIQVHLIHSIRVQAYMEQ